MGVRVGSVTVYAKADGVIGSALLTVTVGAPAFIKIIPKTEDRFLVASSNVL